MKNSSKIFQKTQEIEKSTCRCLRKDVEKKPVLLVRCVAKMVTMDSVLYMTCVYLATSTPEAPAFVLASGLRYIDRLSRSHSVVDSEDPKGLHCRLGRKDFGKDVVWQIGRLQLVRREVPH